MSGPVRLPGRGVVEMTGPDAITLLDGLTTNAINKAGYGSSAHALVLTPQGKFLFDLFVFLVEPERLLIDVSNPAGFARKMAMHKLRALVTITDRSGELCAISSPNGKAPECAVAGGPDSRQTPANQLQLGWRGIGPVISTPLEAGTDWDRWRLEQGVPDLGRDMTVEGDFALEGLLEELNGVDFHKGCYVGQEMTSRMKRRTTVRNKLTRVRYDGAAPAHGTAIEADGWQVGEMRTGVDGVGLALIRHDRAAKATADGHALMAGEVAVRLDVPGWLLLPDAA
jgi:tRNA-modifying protein YgfZ